MAIQVTRERLALAVADAEQQIDGLFAPAAKALADLVRHHAGDQPVTPLVKAKIMADFDRLIRPRIVGAGPQSDSPLRRIVNAYKDAAEGVAAAAVRDDIAAVESDPRWRAAAERSAGVH